MPFNVFISFNEHLITEIEASFNHVYWDDMLPVWDQKYGADWNVEREDMPITDLATNKTTVRERVSLNHVSNGVNRGTNDRCQISATNLDIVFQHHDAYGPYHSLFVITLVSKNF